MVLSSSNYFLVLHKKIFLSVPNIALQSVWAISEVAFHSMKKERFRGFFAAETSLS